MSHRLGLPAVFFALASLGCGSPHGTDDHHDSWSERAPMPTPRSEVAVALVGSTVFVAGGYAGPDVFEAYDLETDEWTVLAKLPMLVDHASLAAVGGVVYLAGGGSALAFAYDPAANTWVQKKSPPYERYASAAVVLDEMLYLIGGIGPAPETPLRYDPASDEWATLAPMAARRDHVGAVVLGDQIYALSGRSPDGSNQTSIEIYDPKTDAWQPGPAMHEGRSGFGAAVLASEIYVAGGELIVDPIHTSDSVEVFDPVSNTWSFVHPMPAPVHGCGAVGSHNRVWLFGGATEAASPTPRDGSVYVYWP